MPPIRIVIIRTPRMLREILEETVAREPDMLVIARDEESDDWFRAVVDCQADVLVCGEEPASAELTRLFSARPLLRLFALGSAGERVVLHELRPERVVLGETSPQRLIAMMREQTRSLVVPG